LLFGLLAAVTWRGIVHPSVIQVVLHADRMEWGIAGKPPECVVHRRDVQSMIFGKDFSYAFLNHGSKLEIGMFGGLDNLNSMVGAVRKYWPETPVSMDTRL
jgi:hypothetical protein